MSRRKSFGKGIDAIFDTAPPKVESEVSPKPVSRGGFDKKGVVEKSIKEARTTVVLDAGMMDTAKAVAHWERKSIKELMSEAVEMLIASRRSENGDDYIEAAVESFPGNR